MKKLIPAIVLAAVCAGVQAQETPKKPDNTAVNKRDRSATEKTADQQKENKSDRELAKNIRRAIVSDKSLSTYAHNVKVVVEHGAVTLKGPVRSEDEKSAVEAKAKGAAGGANVTNELSVANSADRDKPSAMKDKDKEHK